MFERERGGSVSSRRWGGEGTEDESELRVTSRGDLRLSIGQRGDMASGVVVVCCSGDISDFTQHLRDRGKREMVKRERKEKRDLAE
jgi:hypothetical protein